MRQIRQKKENDKENAFFLKIYGLPYENKVHTIVHDNKYGFAYWTSITQDWLFAQGTFEYLYGLFTGIFNMIGDTEDSPSFYCVFFRLNDNYEPIEVINSVKYNTETGEMNDNSRIIMRDLTSTSIEDEDEDIVKPVNFEL